MLATSHGAVPEILPFQNYVVDSDGKPLGTGPDGQSNPRNYDVVFRIHPRSSGADVLWSEQQTVTIDRGLLSVQLGQGLPLQNEPRPVLSEVFRGLGAGERYLSTTIRFSDQSADFEILPRIRLLGNPRALVAHATRSIAGSEGRSLLSILGDSATVDGNLLLSAPLSAPSISGTAASLSGLDASAFTQGTILPQFVPGGLDASRITGTLQQGLFPEVLPADKIGSLNASSITSGTLGAARLPEVMLTTSRPATFTAPVTFNGGLTVHDDLSLGYGALYIGEPGDEDFGLQVREVRSFSSTRDAADTSEKGVTTLWGKDGGVLGDRRHSDRAALSWNASNEVTIHRPLEIASYHSTRTSTGGRNYWGKTNGSWLQILTSFFETFGPDNNYHTSIDADGLVLADSFYSFSDQRIKHDVTTSDATADAGLVDSLRVVDYQMKDRLLRGDAPQRGFIAQEVETLLPGAVTKAPGFLPEAMPEPESVMGDTADGSIRITTTSAHGLTEGCQVSLLAAGKPVVAEVLDCPAPHTFVVRDPKLQLDGLLFHGREISDFRVLDNDQVFSSTISVIQRLMQESDSIHAEIADIERELAELDALESEVRQLTMQLGNASQTSPVSHRSQAPSNP